MKLIKKAGATSEIWQIFIADSSSTTGAGLTGLVFNSGSLTAYYHRDTDTTATAITLVTMTVGTFTSSGFKEIDATNMPGWYQLCPPNAALAAGAKSCGIHLKGATNMAPLPIEVELTAVDPDSATAFITGVNSLAPPTNWNLTVIDGSGRADISKIGGTSQTARDIGASVLLSAGTGTGQLDFTSGVVKANAVQLLGTAWLTPGVAGTPDVNAKLIAAVVPGSATIGTVTTTTTATNLTTNNDKTGYGLSSAAVQAIWDALTSALTTVGSIGKLLVTNIDAAISSRSSYAGGDTSGTTTLLSRLTGTRATNLDNLDATISSRGTSTYSGGAVASVTGAVGSVTAGVTVTTNNDKTGYTASTVSDKTGYSISGTKTTLDALQDISSANVLTQVNGALDAAGTELSSIPTTTGSIRQKLNFVFEYFRNKKTITASVETILKEDAATSLGTRTVADDGTTVTLGEMS